MADLLVPIDFSNTTSIVLATASRLAVSLGARIALMHVEGHGHLGATAELRQEVHLAAQRPAALQDQGHTPVPPFRTVHVAGENVSALHAQELLQRQVDAFRAQGLSVTPILVSGKPIEKILLEARRLQPLMIVLGSHGHGALHHLLLGSVSEGVLRKADCPVVIVPCRPVS
ncbi:MAG: universal stress protein [Tepidisphaeraceae bacterium]|jgi:nucleotide-binding universal stress UspA family protein